MQTLLRQGTLILSVVKYPPYYAEGVWKRISFTLQWITDFNLNNGMVASRFKTS